MAARDLTSLRQTALGAALVDELIEAYIDWRERAGDCRRAYGRWRDGPADTKVGFATYMAALDQEEAAAADYAALVGDVTRWLRG